MLRSLLFRQCTTGFSYSHSRTQVIHRLVSRSYAVHPGQATSSLLSQSLDQKRSAPSGVGSVGPFQLGPAQPALSHGEKVQKWSELSTGGKVMRTTARTTNLTVILLGAGLSAVLIYALTSELFSKNSPTVIYGNACERIKVSVRVAKYLNGPYSFHNNPPSVVRPRHRNRHVSSQIMVDSTGREHMIMNFYVQGRPPGSVPTPSESSYFESLLEWSQEKLSILSDLTLDESIAWSKHKAADIWDRSKMVFKYVSGAPLPPPPSPSAPSIEFRDVTQQNETTAWSFAGMFSGLRGQRAVTEKHSEPDRHVWNDGEVHADLIKNNEGYFVFRYLLIDIPNSRSRNPVRVWVERSPGVRENEPVMRWDS